MAAGPQRCAMAVIEYDGTAFAGSQVQPNARTVQGELEEALNRLIGERTQVRLAGRTDAGVHATGQVAAFCLSRLGRAEMGWPELRRRLNAVLPPDLAVRSLRPASSGFDPRRDALWRVYRYRILANGARRPAHRYRTLEIDDRLDVDAMRAAAERMVGQRDYGSLGSDAHGRTVRHLAEVRVTRRGDLVEVRVTANAFLRRMVRSIVAILLAAGRGRIAPDDVDRLLAGRSRALDGRAAPARGLTLERVVYRSAADNGTRTNRTKASAAPQGAAEEHQGKTGEQGT
jgi:tRNA pseudouridine38-40 synthase